MLISFVIPAFNASKTIDRTLISIFSESFPQTWEIEAVVVDDGSSDGELLRRIVSKYPAARLLVHDDNLGMCAGRNSGILSSLGDVVTILDSDDELIIGWSDVLAEIMEDWPSDINVCYASCRNDKGGVTSQEPEYTGYLTLEDILNERHSGEYLPLFRGDYVRKKSYIDLGMRKSCGILSYINFAKDGPFWITNKVLRIYHEARNGSVTQGWTRPEKAAETVACYHALFDRYGSLYKRFAPRVYRTKLLRLAVYLKLAGLPGAWKVWKQGASPCVYKEMVGAAFILLVGGRLGGMIASSAKKIGLVRKYG